jgi:hypothetical protein
MFIQLKVLNTLQEAAELTGISGKSEKFVHVFAQEPLLYD